MHNVVDISLGADILAANRRIADKNRDILKKRGTVSFDFLGSIGSGKTLLIDRIVKHLKDEGRKVGVICGDVAGEDDYNILRKNDIPIENLNTGKECHLDAHLVGHAVEKIDEDLDFLLIENVGNLVCPGDFPLGTDKRVVVISVTEGDDMVRKHPAMFSLADVIVLNKIDLEQMMGIDVERIERDAAEINPNAKFIKTDAKRKKGINELVFTLKAGIT